MNLLLIRSLIFLILFAFTIFPLFGQFNPTSQRRAIIIGISEYTDKSVPTLPNSYNDAHSFFELLSQNTSEKYNPIKDSPYLTTRNANKDAILARLEDYVRTSKEGDEIIIFFSGHIILSEFNDLYFAFKQYNKNSGYSANDLISIYQLEQWIKNAINKKISVVLIIDGCYSGAIIEPQLKALDGKDNFIRITSSKKAEKSGDDKRFPNSLFTFMLISGLKGLADDNKDSLISFDELEYFISDKFRKDLNKIQVPCFQPSKLNKYFISYKKESVLEAEESVKHYISLIKSENTSNEFLIYKDANADYEHYKGAVKGNEDPDIAAFNSAIEKNNLIDLDSGAWKYYCKIADRDSSLVKDIKYEMLSALLNDVQTVMNKMIMGYYDSKQSYGEFEARYTVEEFSRSTEFRNITYKLAYALTIINDSTSSIYKTLLSKWLFFESFNSYSWQKEDYLLEALKNDSNAAYIYNALGENYSKSSWKISDAERCFKKAIKLEPSWIYPRTNLAKMYYENGDYQIAMNAFQDVLRIDTSSAYAYGKIGEVYYFQNQYDSALIYLLNAMNKSLQNEGEIYTRNVRYLGNVYTKLKDFNNAQICYDAILKSIEKPTDFWDLLDLFWNISDYYYEKGDTNRAVWVFDRLLDYVDEAEYELTKAEIAYSKALFYFNKDFSYDKAIRYFQQANPYFTKNNYSYDQLRIYHYLGQSWANLQNYDSALHYYNIAIGIDTLYTDPWYGVALCYDKTGDSNQAEFAYRKLTEINPSEPWYWYLLGYYLFRERRLDESIKFLRKSIELNDQYSLALHGITIAYLHNNQMREAEKSFMSAKRLYEKEIKKDTTDFSSISNFCELSIILNDYNTALKYSELGLKSAKKDEEKYILMLFKTISLIMLGKEDKSIYFTQNLLHENKKPVGWWFYELKKWLDEVKISKEKKQQISYMIKLLEEGYNDVDFEKSKSKKRK